MTFGSPGFALFATGVLIACAALGRHRRWIVLLVASYTFYAMATSIALLAVLESVTVVSYVCALAIERHANSRRRHFYFWVGVTATVGPLVAMKYAGFLVENFNAVAALAGRPAPLAPVSVVGTIGLSYYVLQAVSYMIDVRDTAIPAERHFGRHALALAFFPKVIQGPIERAECLLPQLRNPRPLCVRDIAAGAQLFVWGLFQKTVVADRLAPFVDAVFSGVQHNAGLPLLVATYLYSAQIYFDFAGYTDMALGLGLALGIRLTPNFASPYLARSVAEFWRRWHISLSSWLLDYVFKPFQLGLRGWRTWGTPVALVLTFLVSGLWHGASWTFVAWGVLHGFYLGASALYRPMQRKLYRALKVEGSRLLALVQVAVTFHLACLGWILFRARSLGDAVTAVQLLASDLPATTMRAVRGHEVDALVYLGQGRGAFLTAIAAIVAGSALRALFRRSGTRTVAPEEDPRPIGLASAYGWTAVYAFLLYGIAMLGTSAQSFLYAQF